MSSLAAHREALSKFRLKDVVHPDFAKLTESVEDFLLTHADESLHYNGILHFPIFSEEGCDKLLPHVRALHGSTAAGGSMHKYGTNVEDICPELLADIGAALRPILTKVYGVGDGVTGLTLHTGHIIGYALSGRDTKLAKHVDDSLFTANINVGVPGFGDNELIFFGNMPVLFPTTYRRAKHHEHEMKVKPKLGYVLMHLGSHPHQTVPISSGERFNFVLWYHERKGDARPSELSPLEAAAEAIGSKAAATATSSAVGGAGSDATSGGSGSDAAVPTTTSASS